MQRPSDSVFVRRPARVLGPLALSAALLLSGLAGCAAEPGAEPQAGGGADAANAAAEGAGSDAGSGWLEVAGDHLCADGESVSIAADEASAVLTGPCGTVRVDGARVQANIESAETVEVGGEGATILGDAWGSATVTAPGVSLNVTEVEDFTTSAPGTTLTNQRVGSVRIDGQGAVLNGVEATSAVLNGDGATVLLSGSLGSLEIHGNGNSVSWVGGAESAVVDAGSGNTLDRRG